MSTDDAWFYFGGGIVVVLGFLCVVLVLVRTHTRRRGWIRVDGTVTSAKTRRKNDGETQTTVRYSYVDGAGRRRTGTDTALLRTPRRKSKIAIRYDPENPERSEPSSMTLPYVALAIAAVFLVLWLLATLEAIAG